MTDDARPKEDEDPREQERKRRLRAKVFGEVLPETTSDERDAPSDEDSSTDAWLKGQVPPHHG